MLKDAANRIANFICVPTDNPELLKAQCQALSRTLPMMYFILMVSTWAVAVIYLYRDLAPVWFAIGIPLVFTLVTAICVVYWRRLFALDASLEVGHRALTRTNRIAGALAVAFVVWLFAFFQYDDAYARWYLAFYMAIIGVVCVLFVMRSVSSFVGMVNARTGAQRRDQEQSRLLRMIDDLPVAVMTLEPETLVVDYANQASKRLIGEIAHLLPIGPDDLIGTGIEMFQLAPEQERCLRADPANLPYSARIHLGSEVLDLQVSAVKADDGNFLYPMLTLALVTKEREAERRIRLLAHHDPLTGLANRTTFRERLDACLALPGMQLGLLYVDLDDFNIINNTRGHCAGDTLLKMVAGRLRTVCDAPDVSIGRFGGDEFAILVPHCDTRKALALATTLVDAFRSPYCLGADQNVRISASIGVALAPVHGDDAETLLIRTDIALNSAKAVGKSAVRIFTVDMEMRAQECAHLEADLRAALDRSQGLFVFYQPIVDVETGKVTSREALVRWHHAQRGWVSPVEFIAIAERSGLIDQLGQFVICRACSDAMGWLDNACVAVNVSPMQLGNGTLAEVVFAALGESGLPADRLEIEVTESAFMRNETDSIKDLYRLYEMGIRVALDDFGTGYSSLALLRAFPFDKIKIDQSFVMAVLARSDCAVLVRAIADLGKRLGATTVAEGVETEALARWVRAAGCHEAQGYYHGHPLPAKHDVSAVSALGLPN